MRQWLTRLLATTIIEQNLLRIARIIVPIRLVYIRRILHCNEQTQLNRSIIILNRDRKQWNRLLHQILISAKWTLNKLILPNETKQSLKWNLFLQIKKTNPTPNKNKLILSNETKRYPIWNYFLQTKKTNPTPNKNKLILSFDNRHSLKWNLLILLIRTSTSQNKKRI